MSLYQDLVDAGVKIDHHESDLYFQATEKSLAILAKYPEKKEIASPFIDSIEHKPWIDIPFAYLPFWEKKKKKNTYSYDEHNDPMLGYE
jgi:hypothetical protein